MTKLSICNNPEMEARQNSIINTLEVVLELAKKGELQSVEVVFTRNDKTWTTLASATADSRTSAAMLMEIAMRRLGFEGQS